MIRFRIAVSAAAMLLLGVTSQSLRAQEIDATVSVNYEQLPIASQQELSTFADDLKRYVENTRWTGENWEGPKIKMNFAVIFTGASGDGMYSTRLVVGSQRHINNSEKTSPMVKILDDSWSFSYTRNQPFVQDPTRYDPLTGLIDFYVYVAIGLDFDSYAYLGGASTYEKAWTLAQRAQIRTDVDGWKTDVTPGTFSKYGLIRELTEMRFAPLRRFIYNYHYNGLDLTTSNKQAALDSINTYIGDLVVAKDKLVQPSVLLRVMSDAKYMEFAELFAGYTDPVIWRKLIYLDPGHQSTFEQARDR
ncbi:MAG: DUF4835 family protein [Bacteroidetes bacterium]|nr:DUF4835 family protein [Bacteroidota bacterium]